MEKTRCTDRSEDVESFGRDDPKATNRLRGISKHHK